jgi:hypothetical protein
MVEVLLVVAVLAVVVLVIAGPLRPGRESTADQPEAGEQAELEAAKESKLREIREAELDFRTGKLSRDDWRALDSALRAEAIEILRRLDTLEGRALERERAERRRLC